MDQNELLQKIRSEFGEQSMFILGKEEKLMDIKVRPSGSLLLDIALGGGYPQGRVLELNGREKSGKTTLLNLLIAESQLLEPEKTCAIIDLEHSFNPEWAKKLGVDVDKLFITQPDTYAEKIFEMIEFMLKSKKFSIIGLDSIAGLISKAEIEEENYENNSQVGGTSKLNARAMRKIVNSGLLTDSGTSLVFINQLRDKIGGFSMYGPQTTTGGGRALKHAYSQVLEVSIGDYFSKGQGDKKKVLGQQIKVKVAKNKIAPPFRTATIDVYYENGIDRVRELVLVAKEIGVLQGTSWLKFVNPSTGEIYSDEDGKEIKWNGTDKTCEALVQDIQENNGILYSLLEATVHETLRG